MARFILTKDSEWQLENAHQDIRGWPVRDRSGRDLGEVRSLVADDQTHMVEAVVLTNGTEIPARDVDVGNGVVYVRGSPAGGGGPSTMSPFGSARVRRY